MNKRWATIPMTVALVGAIALIGTAAHGQTVRTPLQSGATFRGTSGGSQSSQCGFIASEPNLRLEVTESLASLRFQVQGAGEPTLLIRNPQGRIECVMSDRLSGGSIELPGVWERGNYSVFVGDRSGNRHPYTLSVNQN